MWRSMSLMPRSPFRTRGPAGLLVGRYPTDTASNHRPPADNGWESVVSQVFGWEVVELAFLQNVMAVTTNHPGDNQSCVEGRRCGDDALTDSSVPHFTLVSASEAARPGVASPRARGSKGAV
ncbi:hypothetical protein Bbelb_429960 [Branchiostoma belcheri]|nr:hypothetical protein Bbelb_429960 [Branchiostoma belcheri]